VPVLVYQDATNTERPRPNMTSFRISQPDPDKCRVLITIAGEVRGNR
jgi:hypothetical protein